MTTQAASYHSRRIRELSAAQDWAGLMRHWMAYQQEPALAEAVAIARGRETDPAASPLVRYLEEFQESPTTPRALLDPSSLQESTASESATLMLLGLFPHIALCERLDRFPDHEREQLFALGTDAASKGWQLADLLQERALRARFLMTFCNGCLNVGEFGWACNCCEQALDDYHTIEESNPGVVLLELGMVRFNYGMSLRGMGNNLEAVRQFDEAAGCFRRLEQDGPGTCLRLLASALKLSGELWRRLGQFEEARVRLEEARAIVIRCRALSPDESIPDLFAVCENLGIIQRKLGRLAEAYTSFEGALEHLSQGPPGVPPIREAATHFNLVRVSQILDR